MPYTTNNLKNSIWPNGMEVGKNGRKVFKQLGDDKIPLTITGWPKGTKIISPFVYNNNKLSGFCDTKAMTVSNTDTMIYLPYEHIEADFSSIDYGMLQVHAPRATVKTAIWSDGTSKEIPEANFKYKGCKTVKDVKTKDAGYLNRDIIDGTWSQPLWDLEEGSIPEEAWSGLFHGCDNLTSFNSDLPSLSYCYQMFAGCSNLTSFSSDLSSLTDGHGMFSGCDNLTSFGSDLSNLISGGHMFDSCSGLVSFDSNLTNLTTGSYMFNGCDNLTTFDSDLSSLTIGNYMFQYCWNLTTFNTNLSSLTNGEGMFWGCYNITSINFDLSSLTNGRDMFSGCAVLASFDSNLSSLTDGSSMFSQCENLTSFNSNLSSLTDGSYMFFDCKLDTASVQNIADTINTPTSKKTIHVGIGNSTPNEQEEKAFNTIASKNWKVYVNGTSNSNVWNPTATTPIDGEQTATPIPFWAKPVEATEETASYVDSEGNYYNILGAQFIYGDDISTYGMFTCLDDAAANMRLTKIERN